MGQASFLRRSYHKQDFCQSRFWVLWKLICFDYFFFHHSYPISCPRSLPRLRTCWTKWKTMGTWFIWWCHLRPLHPWVTGESKGDEGRALKSFALWFARYKILHLDVPGVKNLAQDFLRTLKSFTQGAHSDVPGWRPSLLSRRGEDQL